jgi:hypothetical protein
VPPPPPSRGHVEPTSLPSADGTCSCCSSKARRLFRRRRFVCLAVRQDHDRPCLAVPCHAGVKPASFAKVQYSAAHVRKYTCILRYCVRCAIVANTPARRLSTASDAVDGRDGSDVAITATAAAARAQFSRPFGTCSIVDGSIQYHYQSTATPEGGMPNARPYRLPWLAGLSVCLQVP